jgi:gamma-glutamyltranspeptidase / glutathione hydrolase
MMKKDKNAPDGCRAPGPGEIMKNPNLATTFRNLAEKGKKEFYTGRIAEEIVRVCKDRGGHLELEDLRKHMEIESETVSF